MKEDGVFFDSGRRKWGYRLKGNVAITYPDKTSAAKAYVTALIEREPKYKPLVQGKTWAEIFRIVGVQI